MTYTIDTKPCGCSRHRGAQRCDECAPKPKATADERKPAVDLNALHKAFWDRLAGRDLG